MTSALTGAAMLAIWFLNPMVYFLAPNLMPELFVFYLVVALIAVRSHTALDHAGSMLGASFVSFSCTVRKRRTFFFIPGLALCEFLRKKYANVMIIIIIFGLGLALETAIVDFLLRGHGILFGRAQAILHGEFAVDLQRDFALSYRVEGASGLVVGEAYAYTPIDMFRRWWFTANTNLDRLGYFSQVLYFLFFRAVCVVSVLNAAGSFAQEAERRECSAFTARV
jgi:hypothetical protein